MKRFWLAVWVAALVVAGAGRAEAGPLEDYVNAPDPNYSYTLVRTVEKDDCTIYVLDLTSQSWREGDVRPHLWQHWLTIVRPKRLTFDKALLVISGGNNLHTTPPSSADKVLIMIATTTNSVVAELQGVPSEPVIFRDEQRSRTEDEIISYTYDKYLETGDPTWPLLCPMVKSAVRAMDAVQSFMGKEAEPPHRIREFVLTGASKRGWTTWLTATVDKRVIAIAPVVIDMLNLKPQMKRQLEYYGAYTEAIQDYTNFNIQARMDTPRGRELLKIVDPYEYRDVLLMPKFIILGAGDQYWTVDAANLYFHDLKGEKYIRYEPNADHGIRNSMPSYQALTAFYYTMMRRERMPQFSWTISPNGSFRVEPVDRPLEVKLWKAHAPTKDFRLVTVGEVWSSEPLSADADGVYRGKVSAPFGGYDAFFVELVYPSSLGFNYSLTTEIAVPRKTYLAFAFLLLPVAAGMGAVVWFKRR